MNLIKHDQQAREDWRPGVSTRMRVSAMNGATALTIFEQWCEPGLGAPLHWHPVEEVLSVLSGNVEIVIDGEMFRATAGYSALIPVASEILVMAHCTCWRSSRRRPSKRITMIARRFRGAGGQRIRMAALLSEFKALQMIRSSPSEV